MYSIRRAPPAAAALMLLALAVFLIMPRLDRGFRAQVEGAILKAKTAAEEETGLSVNFDSLSPSVLRSVALGRLVLRNSHGEIFLAARRVRVFYALGAILEGQAYRAVSEVSLEGVTMNIELPRDLPLLQKLSRYIYDPAINFIPSLVITGRELLVNASVPGTGHFSVSARDFRYSTIGPATELSLAGGFVAEPSLPGVSRIEGPIDLSGSTTKDLSQARLVVSMAARSRDFDLATQRFELVYEGGIAELRKVRDRAPLDADFRLDTRDGSLSASLRLDGFVPRQSVRLAGGLRSLTPWLVSSYTGSLNLSMPEGDIRRMTYNAHLEGSLATGVLAKPFHAALAAEGDLAELRVEYARLQNGADSFEYRGSFSYADLSPDGILDVKADLLGGKLPVAASFRLYGHAGDYAALAETVSAGGVELRDLAFAAAYRRRQLDFRVSFRPPEAEDAGPSLPVPHFAGEAGGTPGGLPRVFCEGSASFDAASSIDLSLNLEEVDLKPLRPLLEALFASPEIVAFLSDLKLGGEVFATSDFSRLSWSASDLAIVSRSAPGAYALLSLSGNLQSLVVRRAFVSAAGYTVEGKGKADFAQAGGLTFEASLKLQDIPYTLNGVLIGDALFITGDYGLDISARAASGETFVKAAARDLPVPVGGGIVLTTFDADGRLASPEDWSVALMSLTLVPTGERIGAAPRIKLSGLLGPGSASFAEMRLEDKVSTLAGSAKVEYSFAGGLSGRLTAVLAAAPRPSNGGSAAGSTAGPSEEHYQLSLAYAKGILDGDVEFRASPLARLVGVPLNGSADGKAHLRGPIERPIVDFSAELRDGKIGEDPLTLFAAGGLDGTVLRFDELRCRYLGHEIQSGSGSFSLANASSSVNVRYADNFGGEHVTLNLQATGKSAAAAGSSLSDCLRNYSVQGSVSGLSYGSLHVERWPFKAIVSAPAFSFEGGATGEFFISYDAGGFFEASARAPLPLRFEARGKTDGKTLEADATEIEMDMPVLAALLPASAFSMESGHAKGALRMTGLLADPEITGRLDLEAAAFHLKGWLADRVGPVDVPLVAGGRSFSLAAPSVPIGDATLSIVASAVLDHWSLVDFKASVRTAEGARIRLDTAIKGVMVQGEAAFDCNIELQRDILSLEGNLSLDKGSVVISPDLFAAGPADTGPPPAFYLAATTRFRFGRSVQVFFPSRDLPIVTGYTEPSSTLDLHYDQAAQDLTLKGSLGLRGGDVFYIERDFFLKSAQLVFNESSIRFDPHVTLLAELRDRNDSGPVLITLSADNVPISNFKPTLTSDPPMTEAQIADLLGTSLFGVAADRQFDLKKAVITSSEFIPQLNVTNAFERRIRNSLGLDVFFLRTQILQRWLLGLSVQTAPAATDALGQYLDETALYAGKYLGDAVFLHGEARLKEDPLVGSGHLLLDSEVGVELDTPFGIVQWSITPGYPDNLIEINQSLSLTWRLSY